MDLKRKKQALADAKQCAKDHYNWCLLLIDSENDFRATIKKYLAATGMTQGALAEHFGVSPGFMSLALSGGKKVPRAWYNVGLPK